jgi:hypothetical protein
VGFNVITIGPKIQRGVFAGLLLVGLLLLRLRWLAWSWSAIGGLLALVGTILLLFRDQIKEYGEVFESQSMANSGGRPLARTVHPLVYSIAIPLVLLSALFQVVGNPSDKLLIRATRIPDSVVFIPLAGKMLSLDLPKLDTALHLLASSQHRTDSVLGTVTDRELLIVNCARSSACLCPKSYQRVRDTGRWNLNAGTPGDRITLCVHTRRYLDSSP